MFLHINFSMRCPLLQQALCRWNQVVQHCKLLEIFQTVSRNFSKSCSKNNQKLLFVTKVAGRNKSFFRSDAKICKLYNKSTISKHCCAILRQNQPCKITLSSIKTKKCNEPWPSLPETLKSVECESSSTILNFP